MKKESSIYLLFILFLFHQIAANIAHPITPLFVTSQNIESYMFGVFFAAMALGLTVGGLFFGFLGDQYQKKYMIMIGYTLYAIGQLGFGYTSNQYVMVAFRFVSGFGASATITLMTAQVVASSSKENRTKFLGYLAAAMTLGSSMGYYLGGQLGSNETLVRLLNTDELSHIFLIQALMNIILALIIYKVFNYKQTIDQSKKSNFIVALKSISSLKLPLILFLISLTLFSMGRINTEKYLDVYFNDLGYTTGDIGTFVMLTGIISLITSICVVPLVNKIRFKLVLIMTLHLLAGLIIFYVFRANNFIVIVYTLYMLYIVIRTLYQPLEQAYIANHAEQGQYSLIMGIRQAFYSLGMIIGPLVGGLIYQEKPIYLFDSSAALFLMSALILVIIMLIQKKKMKSV